MARSGLESTSLVCRHIRISLDLASSWLSDAQRAEVLLDVVACAGKIADPNKARDAAAKVRMLSQSAHCADDSDRGCVDVPVLSS